MEDRVLLALVLLFFMLVTAGWFGVNFYRKRRAFKIRQSGRNKS